jgi:peptidase E
MGGLICSGQDFGEHGGGKTFELFFDLYQVKALTELRSKVLEGLLSL